MLTSISTEDSKVTYEGKEFSDSDLSREQLQDLSFARQYWVPKKNGKPVSPSTIQRWISKGINGIRLEVVYVGRKPHTSRAALQRFFGEVTAKRAAELAAAHGAMELASSLALLEAGLIKEGSLPKRRGKK